ncbi:hypothetical protein E2C01_052873 [Portunus trituberculatus]|uniref:Uncharacterized protein n=1 Tax=Portunus trituberculatus TaxID=210409 RepID=A0A5B7GMW1_PORTR|nr:hypothetical protein [Portunus trituberculatus]
MMRDVATLAPPHRPTSESDGVLPGSPPRLAHPQTPHAPHLSAADAAWHRSCLLSDRVTDHLPHLSSSTLYSAAGAACLSLRHTSLRRWQR